MITNTILLLLCFIAVFLTSKQLATYTVLSGYRWFWDFKDYLYAKFPHKSKLIESVFCNKIFFCQNCNAFWVGFILFLSGASLNVISPATAVILSLLNYLMQVDQSIAEDEE